MDFDGDVTTVPTAQIDLFGALYAQDPYPILQTLRDLGPAVYVPAQDFWAITRYADVREAVGDWQTYSSARGVALLEEFNVPLLGSILGSDPPQHTKLRSVLSEQLSPRGIAALRTRIAARVEEVVEQALTTDAIDGVTDLGAEIPLQVVADLIGVPQEGRERLLSGADAVNTTFGPLTQTLQARMPVFLAYVEWMNEVTTRERLAPGSWGAALFDAADAGRIEQQEAVVMIHAILVAGLATTASALSSMLRVFAERPDVWEQVVAEPQLAGPVFEETVRFESPVQGFFRVATREVTLGEATIPSGARVLVHFASANRDERHYPDPDRFDPRRNPLDHMAFGYGVHGCVGQALARLEGRSLVEALARRVERFDLAGVPVVHENPVMRGLDSLPLAITRRAS